MKTIRLTLLLMIGLLLLPFFAEAKADARNQEGVSGLIRAVGGQFEVITVARWETQYRAQLEGMIPGETPAAYLQRIINQKISLIDPAFAARLDSALTKVLTSEWRDVPYLVNSSHTGKIKGNYKRAGWSLAQLIVRESDSKKDQSNKPTIRYDKQLFSLLHPFDIALALLHEAVYAMDAQLKQKHSYNVRKLVTRLLAKDTLGIKDELRALYDQRELTKRFHKDLDRIDLDRLVK